MCGSISQHQIQARSAFFLKPFVVVFTTPHLFLVRQRRQYWERGRGNMGVKLASRVLLILSMMASVALITAGHFFPVFSTSSPAASFSTWKNCRTAGGNYNCYVKFSVPAASADCSEMDDRTTTIAVYSCIWGAACLQTIFVLVWELCGRSVPISNLQGFLFGWTGIVGSVLAVIVCQTLIANLCSSPLKFGEEGGKLELGGIFFLSAAGASLVPFVFYLVAPNDDYVV